jgi:methyltransferase
VVTPSIDDGRLLYAALVGAVAVERLIEMAVSRRNARRLSRRGAVEVGREHYPWMVALHGAFLIACPLEVILLERPFFPWLGWPMLTLVAATMGLRYWVVATLGERWNTRVLYVPGAPLVRGGPFRWIRHPNYLAVVVELAALPLVHTAWLTALAFGLANALLLRRRLRVENDALERFPALAGAGRP